jgi:WD40 repeat protein
MTKSIPVALSFVISFTSVGQTLETVIQKGHELAVVAVAIHPDSNFVATASKDKSIKLWDVNTGREVKSYLGHESTVTSIEFSSDGKTLISGSHDKTTRFWDVETAKEVFTISGEDFIFDVAIDPQVRFFVTAGYNRTGEQDSASIFDYKTRKKIKSLPINPNEGRGFGVSLAISADGKWLGFGEDNRTVNLYKTDTWERAYKFEYEEGWCGGCATMIGFHPNNKTMFMASYKGPLKKYDLATGKLVHTYEAKVEDLTGLAISPDGKLIARATEKDVAILEEATGKEVEKFSAADNGDFNKIQFTKDSKKLLVTSNDNTAFAWNISQHKKQFVLTGFLNGLDKGGLNYDPNFHWESAIAKYVRYKNSLLITPDGKTLIKGKFGTKVKQWEIASGKAVMNFSAHKKAVLCYDLSRDGKKLVTGGGDGKIILWNVDSGDTLKVINSYREPIFNIQFNSDETLVATSGWDATMKIHDLATGKLKTYFEFESYAAYNLLYHPNDLYLFTSRLDNSMQLWEIDTRTPVRNFVGHTDLITSIAVSDDQQTLMSSSADGSIRLWDIGSGLMKKKLLGHRGAVFSAIFSNDGKNIYSAGADRVIRQWDIGSSKVVKTFTGHKSDITNLLFSPDNKMLISHDVDGVTKFWDMNSGQEFFEQIQLGENDWMAKNPAGYFNATEGARKYIHFVNGLNTYSVDQFFNDYYRPDLLPKIFQNRGSSEMKSLQGKLQSSPPPTVKVAVIATGDGKADVMVKIVDNGNGVQSLKLFHNGKNVALDAQLLKLPNGKGQSTTYRHNANLVGGPNMFTATATNRDQLEADPQTAEIFSDHPSKSSVCHILAVGINRYKNPKLALNYAKDDAESFLKTLTQRSQSIFKSIEVHPIFDEEATRDNILKQMDLLGAALNPEDVFIFYYAGHGSMVNDVFYFIPTETSRLYDESALHKEAIEAGQLQDKFKNIKALKQLIIMDACQSGGSVEVLAARGASEEKAIAQLSRSAGIHVMASAGSEQFAAEFASLGHGMFTYVLLKGLEGAADGAPKDGKVTINELKSFIDDQVPELTRKMKGRPQYPYTFSRGQDFPVTINEQ